jgi:uncharacterized RDD family membrane protein YckC
METISVRTTQNIDIDYETGGLGERILARLIDIGIFIPFLFGGIFFAVGGLNNVAIGYYIVLGALFVFYDLLCEVFFNGQSLGKRVMKIRVISLNGARPTFGQYLLRWLFRLVDFALSSGIAALISVAVSPKGQRLGDLVAGTAIIKTSPRTKRDNIVFAPMEDAYQLVFQQASQLNDKDIELIHEVMSNYYKSGNNVLVYTMADKMREHLAVNLPPNMNAMQFLQTLIKDYSHISSQIEAL